MNHQLLQQQSRILQEVSRRLTCDTSFVPVVSAEIEFYLSQPPSESFQRDIFDHCDIAREMEQEKGVHQYEVKLHTTSDPVMLADTITSVRQTIATVSHSHGMTADFSAMPFADQPGSGLHIHMNLLDSSGNNVFRKEGEEETDIMHHAIGGLLELMPASMIHFSPDEASYARYQGRKESPATVSWGGNNRTVALRLPTTTGAPETRRIEHRVPAAHSNAYAVLSCILAGVHYGLTNRIQPASPKLYGNASLDQYNMPLLPQSLAEAKACRHEVVDAISNWELAISN